MARNVFISFRYSDGNKYKEYLSHILDKCSYTVDFSEDVDRSNKTDNTIKQYLYAKLRRSSVTIILLTPSAVNHKKDWRGDYDDWMYDEIRYSLEDRGGNRTNGLIAVYTPEAENMLINKSYPGVVRVKNVDNIFRRNMMNVKQYYKMNPKSDKFDRNYDSYCSLIEWNEFINNIEIFIDIAIKKKR